MAKSPVRRDTIEKRRYRKVSTRMYFDAKFAALSPVKPSGQSLWLYLITGPHTNSVPGLFVAGEAQLAEALRWDMDAFRSCWREIAACGMAEADWIARLVWLPRAICHNIPESPNVVTSWRVHLDELPACELRDRAFARLFEVLRSIGEGAYAKAFAEALPEAFGEGVGGGFAEGSRKASPNQEQEQEQESTPLPPVNGGRITRSERKRAEELRRRAFGCTHEPRCESYEACIVTIVLGLREQAATA